MKYVFSATLIGLVLVGCTDHKKPTQETTPEQTSVSAPATTATATDTAVDQATAQDEQVIHFTGPQDLTLELKTKDNFETAQLTDNSDQTYELKRVISGSGIRLANDQGVAIHFKDFNGVNEGTVELVKDKPIEIKEFKSK